MEQLNLKLTLNENGSITANWSRITGAVRYHVYMYTPGKDYMYYNEANLTTTSYTSAPGLEANRQYKVIAAAYSSNVHIVSDSQQVLISSDFYNKLPLDIPKNVKAVADTISVTVSFDKVDRATQYDILFDGAVYTETAQTKKITGLKPKTSHTYAVRAKNANKTGEYSPTKTIMTLPQTPAIPTNIKKEVTETSAVISWGAVNNATSYDILFNGNTYNVTSNSKTFTALSSGTAYKFQIRSKDVDVVSAYTNEMTVTTVPKPPTNVTAVSNEDSITVSWSAVAGASGYMIRWNNMEVHCPATPTSNKFTGLKDNTSYDYQVCSKSPDGSGSYSTKKTIMTSPKPPSTPSLTSTKDSVTVNWAAVAGATSYDVLLEDKTYRVTGTSKTITGLTPGTSYSCAIRANNAGGSSSYTSTQVITTIPNPPGVPTDIKVSSTYDSVTISWNSVPGATSYDVMFDSKVYNTKETSKTINDLEADSGYRYSVRANNAGGSSSYTDSKTTQTTVKPPATPNNVDTTATEDSVTVSWERVPGASSYDVTFDDKTYTTTGTSKTISGLQAGKKYTYSVRANNAGGSSSYTTNRTITTIPGKPSGVKVSVTPESVTVSWDAVPGATGYNLKFNGTVYDVPGTSKTITGLNPNTNYQYEVSAKNESGSGSYTPSDIIRTPVKPPITPMNISAAVTAESATITWNRVVDATSYDVLFNGTVYSMTNTSAMFTGLTANSRYSFAVRAKNEGGMSSYSTTQTLLTLPNPPASVNATAAKNSITVSWSAVSGVTGYDVSLGGKIYSVTSTSYTITGLIAGISYSYAVRAKNASGPGAYSASKVIQTLPELPVVPSAISATVTADSATISWNHVVGAASYDVLFNGTTYNVTDPFRTFTGLASNTNYTYAVRARNVSGTSAYSSTQTLRTLLKPPSNVNATATKNTVTVSWGAVAGATSYDVLFAGNVYSVTGTSNTFTELMAGTEYTYSVRAVNTFGVSVYSNGATIRTFPEPPGVPMEIGAFTTADSVEVMWNMVSGAISYDVLFDGKVSTVTGTSLKVNGLMSNTDYAYRVRAKNESGSSDYSLEHVARTLLNIPTNVNASADVDTVRVSWNASIGATSYEVKLNGVIHNVTDTMVEFTGLKPYTDYTYSVSAKNDITYSLYSKPATIKTLRDAPPTPTNVRAVADFNSIMISWDPSEEAISYEVQFDNNIYQVSSAARMFSFRSAHNTEPNTFILFTGLRPNTIHSYCVCANGERGTSEFSPLQFIRTDISKRSGLPNVKPNNTYPDGRIAHMGLDPVNALTGAFLWSYTFLEDYGRDSLHFTAMYDSQRDEYSEVLGIKWSYSLNYLLYMDEEYAYFSTPYGEVIPFAKDEENGGFNPVAGVLPGYTMGKKEDQTYFVRDLDGTEYVFDKALHLSKIVESGIVTYRFLTDEVKQTTRIEGRHGGALVLTYANGRISKVSDTTGNMASFTYDEDYLLSVVNNEGNGISFTYDDAGSLLTITDFSGNIYLVNNYDIYGRVIAQSVSGRGDSFVSYDESARTTTFTDELGNKTKYYYDEKLHVTDVKLAGIGIHNRYNENGQLIERIDGLGNSMQMSYDECGRMDHVIYPDTTEEQVFYNEQNLPVRIVNRDGTESLYGYDERNNLIWAQDERGNKCSYTYDDKDNMASYIDKNGKTWTYKYDAGNHLERAVDPEGNVYLYSHDAIGRLLSHTTPRGETTSYYYSSVGELLRIEDVDGTVAFEYDKNGCRTNVVDRMGNEQHLEYNEMGQVLLATDFIGNEYKFAYDQKGNLIRETDPLGYNQSYSYDALGNCTSWTDKNGGTTSYSFDAASQLREVKDAAGSLVRYTYDTMGQVKTITDARNNQTGYCYDIMGRITSITNALGDSITYTYDQAGNLLTKTDEDGNVMEYFYDSENRLSSICSVVGTVHLTYDNNGRLSTVRDEEDHLEKTTYDEDGNPTSFADKEGNQTTYTYDDLGRLSEEVDPIGNKTTYVYDKNRNCTKITDAGGHVYEYEYDANNRLIKETDPLGYEVVYEYNERGDLTTATDARGGKTTFEYDGNGNLIKETNPADGVKRYSYDRLNRMTEAVDEEGFKRSYVYDVNGNMTSYLDANENRWEYEYDAVNRLINVSGQDGGCLTFEYTKGGKVSKVIDQEGAETSYRYDTMGRLLEMSDALGNSLSWTYDSLNRVRTQTDANGNTTEYEYSPTGNLLCMRDSEGGVSSYTYNALGQVLTKTDALNHVTTYSYNALGQVISVIDAMGGETFFAYTPTGKIASVTDATGGITSYQYDACGNLLQTIDPLGNTVSYEYDSMNNQIKECLSTEGEESCITLYQYDKKGCIVREINPISDEKLYTYDANGNLTSIMDEDGNKTTIRYDLNNRPVEMNYGNGEEAMFRYNLRGELVEMKDWNGIASMEYGRTGRLSKVTDHNNHTIGYSYDARGNITGITYPDGSTVERSYDKANRLVGVKDAEEVTTQYTYDPIGNLLSVSRPDSTSAYTYNANNLPENVKYQFGDGTIVEENLTYDVLGRIIGSERTGSKQMKGSSAAYSYDALGRLLSCKEGSAKESYEYDSLGNRIRKRLDGLQTASYQYNTLNQLISRIEDGTTYSYGYDRRGNLTEERKEDTLVKQYAYNTANRMYLGMDMESGEATEYRYNAFQMRIGNSQKMRNIHSGYMSHAKNMDTPDRPSAFRTKETEYVMDFLSNTDNELVAYEKGFGSYRTTYGRGYERLTQKVTPKPEAELSPKLSIATEAIGKSYFQSDLYGSPLFAVDEDGDMLRYTERSVWGNLTIPLREDMNTSGVDNSLRFTSYQYDSVIGKYYAQARFYDSGLGRMLALDPIKRGLNGYPYCSSDPVNYVDPTGEIANVLAGGIIGGLTGGAFGLVGSAISQVASGEGFDARKAMGAAANGIITGAMRGALVGSGAGIPLALASDFTAGVVGNALEQKISRGNVDLRESLINGLTNAISGAFYGNAPLKNAKDAFLRGAGAGAATAAINNLAETWGLRNRSMEDYTGNSGGGRGRYVASPYTVQRNPGSICGVPNPLGGSIGYGISYGYQYEEAGANRYVSTSRQQKNGFDLGDFLKDTLIGAATGGLASAAFYGGSKKVSAVMDSIRSNHSNKGGSQPQTSGTYYPKDANGNPIPLQKQRVKNQDIPLPDPTAQGPHTTIGGKISSETGLPYRQSATFPEGTWPTANGQNVPWSEVHWGDHGSSWNHPNPHQHTFKYDFQQRSWMRQEQTNFYY